VDPDKLAGGDIDVFTKVNEHNDVPWMGYLKMFSSTENLAMVEKIHAHEEALKGASATGMKARLSLTFSAPNGICAPYEAYPGLADDRPVVARAPDQPPPQRHHPRGKLAVEGRRRHQAVQADCWTEMDARPSGCRRDGVPDEQGLQWRRGRYWQGGLVENDGGEAGQWADEQEDDLG
jgi:hypothetical protein